MIIRLALITLAILMLSQVGLADSPIGCEVQNSTLLKCWNQGDIQQVTFYAWAADSMQFANNNTARLSWAKYDHGFTYNDTNGTPQFISFFDLPNLTGRWDTDEETYYLLNFSGTNTIGGKTAYVEYTAGQLLEDDYVNFTLRIRTISGFTAWGKYVNLYRRMSKINVMNDNDVDIINVFGINNSGANESYGYYLNQSKNLTVTDKNFTIGDWHSNPTGLIEWDWRDDMNRRMYIFPNGANPNYQVAWLRPVRNKIQDNRTYELSEYWIDAPGCLYTCPIGVSYGVHYDRCDATDSQANCSADINRMIDLYYRIQWFAILGSGTCSMGSGCYIQQRDNTNIFFFETKFKTDTNPLYDQLHCINNSKPQCLQDTIRSCSTPFCSTSETQRYRVQCIKATNNTYTNGYFIEFANPANNQLQLFCPGDKAISVNITAYPDGESFNVSDEIPFGCNVSDYYPLQNKTLWGNWSGWGIKETQTLRYRTFNDTNFSTVTGLDPGVYAWNCLGCDNNDECSFDSSNNTFTVVDQEAPYVLLNAPANDSSFWDNETFTFNCTGVDEYRISNVSLWHNLTGVWHLNVTGKSVIAQTNFTLTNVTSNQSIGTYAWNCEACDTFNNCAFNQTNFTLHINDSTVPVEEEEEEETDDFIPMLLLFVLAGAVVWFIYSRRRRQNEF